MKRCRFILLLIAYTWSCAGLANPAQTNPAQNNPVHNSNSVHNNPIDSMQRWGSGEFRRYGFLIYAATLWAAGDDPTQPPLAIQLTYKRTISADAIVDASVDEIRKLAVANDTQLAQWRAQMKKLFPDVHPGDHILGVYDAQGARFFYNDNFIGTIESAEFARAFFGIWLDAKTSAPDLRNALLAPAPS